jgi:uncharacterized membrane protein YdjX (TVP38/TMEM64 family)
VSDEAPETKAAGPVWRRIWPRIWPLATLGALLIAVVATDLRDLISLEALRAHHAALSGWIAARPFASGAAFFAVVAGVMAIGFPIVAVVTFAGGLLFGAWIGAALSLVGATAGGIVFFLAARHARGIVLNSRLRGALRWLEGSFRGNEFLALLMLRLVPVFPTAAVTLAAAAAHIKARDFALASLIGAAPASFIYAGIGAGADSLLRSGGDLSLALLRPEIFAPLMGLAALALLAIWLRRRAARRV